MAYVGILLLAYLDIFLLLNGVGSLKAAALLHRGDEDRKAHYKSDALGYAAQAALFLLLTVLGLAWLARLVRGVLP